MRAARRLCGRAEAHRHAARHRTGQKFTSLHIWIPCHMEHSDHITEAGTTFLSSANFCHNE
ncbi:hypothetical protein SBA4_3510004 [Candidatus Sulfopaludibacter sp. SbA4]|nr:hypothetical protein SBA4_3510004 [Candidatus Sulfopaludibacter sp. SbA4]